MQTAWTFGGLPSLSLPLLTLNGDRPLGVQAVGALHDDARLLAVQPLAGRPVRPAEPARMSRIEGLFGLLGLLLPVAFLATFVFRLPQQDITLIPLGGLALAGHDFLTARFASAPPARE